MERMTKRDENGEVDIIVSDDRIGVEIKTLEVALERFAEYEDTGLMPGDIKDLKNELCLLCGKYKDSHIGACNECKWRKV